MTTRTDDHNSILPHVPDTASARAEVRQFLLALAGLAFVLSTLGTRDGGPMAFAADIVLVLCGAWCANQLIRGFDILKEQVICVLQAYFVGLLCCSVVLFGVGWLLFLPSEYLNLGSSLLYAATFTTNYALALLPADTGLRFDGLLDHLWVPSLIAQCCAILALLYWLLQRNTRALLLVLGVFAVGSLSISTSESPIVHLLPLGGMWAFLAGAIPFFAANRYPVFRHALLLGIISLMAGVFAAAAMGDTLFARAFFAIGVSFLYLGSRPSNSRPSETDRRRSWFGMALHLFLWAIPLVQISSAIDILNPGKPDLTALMMPCILLAVLSWSLWQQLEHRLHLHRITPTAVLSGILLANGLISLSAQGMQIRFLDQSSAYIHAIEASQNTMSCPVQSTGPLAGLEVCKIGPDTRPTVLIWGDHQLAAMKSGYAEAARRANVSALLIAHEDCVPLEGLQTRFTDAEHQSGRSCDQRTAQVLQALPHLTNIRQVTLVADWLFYMRSSDHMVEQHAPVRLGPVDGTPINLDHQAKYVALATEHTVQTLLDQHLRVSILRQVPAFPQFDAEFAARASAPGGSIYQSMPILSDSVSRKDAEARNAQVDEMLRMLAAKGKIAYIDTWSAFCSSSRCDARGGLSSEYVTSTLLAPTGALSLIPFLEEDLKRAKTHQPLRRGYGS